MTEAGGASVGVPSAAARAPARSSGLSIGRSRRGRAASPAARPAASSRQWAARRVTVSGSYRSVLYSTAPTSVPSAASSNSNMRSKGRESRETLSGSVLRPGKAGAGPVAPWSTTMAWTSGIRAGSRSGATASTTRSKGTSWWSKASRTVALVAARKSPTVVAPSTSARSTRVWTKKPIRSSSSGRSRPAVTVPRATSRCPLRRPSSSWVAAVSSMKRLTPCSRPTRASPVAVAAGTAKVWTAPLPVRTAGRGRSAGSSSGSRPASRSCQYASPSSAAGRSCCQAAKSAYWTGSGRNAGSVPVSSAA